MPFLFRKSISPANYFHESYLKRSLREYQSIPNTIIGHLKLDFPGKGSMGNWEKKSNLSDFLAISSANIFPAIIDKATPWPEYPEIEYAVSETFLKQGNRFLVIANVPPQEKSILLSFNCG